MRLITFTQLGTTRIGLIKGGDVIDAPQTGRHSGDQRSATGGTEEDIIQTAFKAEGDLVLVD